MPIRAGKLDKRVTIQETTEGQDVYGAVTDSWGTFATRWASIEPLNGKEYFQVAERNAEVNTRITMRYISGVTPKMRVLYDGRTYDIQSVISHRENKRETVLMCIEDV